MIALVANGLMPTRPDVVALLRSAQYCVGCDCAPAGLTLTQVVGDGDTLSDEDRVRVGDRLSVVSEQESNDLSKGYQWCRAHLPLEPIVIFGGTGRREDHALANLALLAEFAQTDAERELANESVSMVSDFGRMVAVVPPARLAVMSGQQVSFFTFDPRQALSVTGVKYPVDGLCCPRWNRASLNEATGNIIELSASTPDAVLVYLKHMESL